MSAVTPTELALQHLLLRLRPVNRMLRQVAEYQAEKASRLAPAELSRACITEEHARQLFALVEDPASHAWPPAETGLNQEERLSEERLRSQAREMGIALPLDRAYAELGLSPFEQQALVTCTAPELDLAYARLFGYVHDDLNRLQPSLELLCGLGADTLAERTGRRLQLEVHGRLCRLGLLRIVDDPGQALARSYALGAGVYTALTTPDVSWTTRFTDRDEIDLGDALPLTVFPDCAELGRLAGALRRDPACLLGLWGRPHHGPADAARAVAARAGRSLREIHISGDEPDTLRDAISRAEALGSALWLDTDALDDACPPGSLQGACKLLAGAAVPLLMSGSRPWYPLALLGGRNLLDLHLASPSLEQREQLWRLLATDLDQATARDLAVRYQLSPREMQTAIRSARARSHLGGNGHGQSVDHDLPAACRAVVQRQGARFATLVTPQRRPEELILPAELHRRVVEVASMYRHAALVDDAWGFNHMAPRGGMRVLMTGDSGTGKTAAAEVIAGTLDNGPTLLKVDLSSVVSKWVGETEKNLESVFQHAEESHCVLFFDEADALFSKRGEVQRGSDRYSNLEVGYLLQRLENFAGLAILATNHRDQLDPAFTRRFQVVLHFPRPGLEERQRLWQLALPEAAPLASDVDVEALNHLDLTGAGIAGAARTAALLAADGGSDRIGMQHLVRAVARQYQNEARLLPLAQIGRYAELAEREM